MSLHVVDTWVSDGDVPAVSAVGVGPSDVGRVHVAGDARPDSLFALASLTKPIVAVAVLVAAEEGALDRDAPVAAHLATYRDGARAGITARHLLSHASGLPETARGVPPL